MKRAPIALLLFCLLWPLASSAQEKIESTYERDSAHYQLKTSIQWATSDRFGPNTIVMRFSVFRNDVFLHPKSVEGGTLFGGVTGLSPSLREGVTVRPFENIGWIVNMGAIRGNTHSDTYTLILPKRFIGTWTYLQESFIAKYDPVTRWNADKLEIWSCYQEWGGGGTSFSFFVPELREIIFEDEHLRVRQPPLPADLTQWPELQYVNITGMFVAGLSQLNPSLMEAAAARFTEEYREIWENHGLPVTPQEQKTLIEGVRRAAHLREQFDALKLKWSN